MKGKPNQPRKWLMKVPYKHIDGFRYVLKLTIEATSKHEALTFGLKEATKQVPTEFDKSKVKIKRC